MAVSHIKDVLSLVNTHRAGWVRGDEKFSSPEQPSRCYTRFYYHQSHAEHLPAHLASSLSHIDGLYNPVGSYPLLSRFAVHEGSVPLFWYNGRVNPYDQCFVAQDREYFPRCENFSKGWERVVAGVNMMWRKAILNQNTASLIQKEIDHDNELVFITRHAYVAELDFQKRALIFVLGFGVLLRGIISPILSTLLCGWITWIVDWVVDTFIEHQPDLINYFRELHTMHLRAFVFSESMSLAHITDDYHLFTPDPNWRGDHGGYFEIHLPPAPLVEMQYPFVPGVGQVQ